MSHELRTQMASVIDTMMNDTQAAGHFSSKEELARILVAQANTLLNTAMVVINATSLIEAIGYIEEPTQAMMVVYNPGLGNKVIGLERFRTIRNTTRDWFADERQRLSNTYTDVLQQRLLAAANV